jgi:hypothetical protein
MLANAEYSAARWSLFRATLAAKTLRNGNRASAVGAKE